MWRSDDEALNLVGALDDLQHFGLAQYRSAGKSLT